MKDNKRIRNYFWVRAKRAVVNEHEEVEWLRVDGLRSLELPRPVVLVNGAFDLCHSGHKKLLFEARHQAGERGTVVVAMDSDERVRSAKGVDRPILTWVERSVDLEYMPIDYLVEIATDQEFGRLIRALRPDLRVSGADHPQSESKYPDVRKALLPKRGLSTSDIVRRIEERFAKRSTSPKNG